MPRLTQAQMSNLMVIYDNETDPVCRNHLGSIIRRQVKLFTDRPATTATPRPYGPNDFSRMTNEEIHAAMGTGKIHAIKLVRDRTHLGLLDAKRMVERLVPECVQTF